MVKRFQQMARFLFSITSQNDLLVKFLHVDNVHSTSAGTSFEQAVALIQSVTGRDVK